MRRSQLHHVWSRCIGLGSLSRGAKRVAEGRGRAAEWPLVGTKPLCCAIAVALLGHASAAAAAESEIWISPIGPANTNATGSPYDPFRCPTGASLNTVMQARPASTTFHLMAGTFLVDPPIALKAGWKLRGAGIDNTVVKLAPNETGGGWCVIYPAVKPCNGNEVSDMTVDCNLQNQASVGYMSAVGLDGSDTRISSVKAINWGATGAGSEAFVLAIGDAPVGYNITNAVIEKCIVRQPAPRLLGGGACGITVVSGPPKVVGGIIEDNLVESVSAGTGAGQPAWFNAYSAWGTLRHNRAINIYGNGVYCDTPGTTGDFVIDGNYMRNVYDCINFNMVGTQIVGVTIADNDLQPSSGGCGISYYTGECSQYPSAYVANLVVKDNIVVPYNNAGATRALQLNGYVSGIVTDNILQGSPDGYDFFVNPANEAGLSISTWSGNVDFRGNVVNP